MGHPFYIIYEACRITNRRASVIHKLSVIGGVPLRFNQQNYVKIDLS